MVKRELGANPLSGELFVFVNRKKTQMKILYFDGDKYAVCCKRLERSLRMSEEFKNLLPTVRGEVKSVNLVVPAPNLTATSKE